MAVDAAAYAREREALLAPGPAGGEREARAAEIDLARRILRDERRRSRYDALWRAFQSGAINITHLEGLRALQDEVRLEVAEERGERPDPSDAASLLRQGLGLAQAGMSREAIEPLRAAVRALPDSAEAHQAYAGAILASGDPLDLGAHLLRQALASIEASERLGAMAPGGAASAALCRGLLARDAGDAQGAEEALRAAVREDRGSGAAWRGLAALALARGDHEDALAACRRALAIDRRDERALLMAAAACARARRHGEAREAAGHIAALRGGGWTAEEVLREIV
jgi:tetratricopeptide (TPR) repeat protein